MQQQRPLLLIAIVCGVAAFIGVRLYQQRLQGGAADLEPEHAALISKPATDFKADFVVGTGPASLQELRGKVVLLDFFAVWCGPCIRTFPELAHWRAEFGPKGLEIVGVTTYYRTQDWDDAAGRLRRVDSPLTPEKERDMLARFGKHYQLGHPIWLLSSDDYRRISEAYAVEGIPQIVLIDREGVMALIEVGGGGQTPAAITAELKSLLP